jgi:pimeloyl-ACP methyl ester carboxylesterase
VPTVDIDGVNLAYDERGNGPPVLLVHGTGGNVWGELPDMLAAAGQRAIYYHRRGFGASKCAPIKDPPRHTADAAALLERLDAAPALVVGHSMGGMLSVDLTIRRPELVSALVLIEPPLHFKTHPSFTMMRALIGAQIVRHTRGAEPAAERFMRWATRTTDGANGYDATPPEVQAELAANGSAIMRELDSGTGEHVKNAEIAKIACPVELLLGGNTLPAYGKAARRIKKALPSLEIVTVPGAGHVLPVSHSQAVVDAVKRVRGLGDGGRSVDESGEVAIG